MLAYRISEKGGELLWSLPQCADGGASPVIHAGHVYLVCRDLAVCAELATGNVAWEKKLSARGYSSPLIADGKLFALVGRGLYALRASPARYELLARARLSALEHSSPAIAGGRLYVRMKKGLGCYDLTPHRAGNPTPAE